MALETLQSSNPTYHSERNLFAWSLLAGLMIFAFMAGPFFFGRIYSRNDLGAYHLPVRAFYAQQLAEGEPFDWMPQIFSGYYLTGEGQAGTYHPLHYLLYRWLPLQAALDLEWLISYPFMLAGMWLFLRRIIGSNSAAMFGSVLFTYCGFNLLHFIHPNAVAIVAHIPWLLWAIDIVLIDDRRVKVYSALSVIALLTGSQLLLGYPQFVWFSLLTECAFTLYLLIERHYGMHVGLAQINSRKNFGRVFASSWPDLVLAKIVGLFLGGIQLLPTVDALLHSSRQTPDPTFAFSGSLHPLNLLQLVAPYLFVNRVVGQNTHELGVYIGAVPLVLIVWLVMQGRTLSNYKTLALSVSLFGAMALLLAFGQYGSIYRVIAELPLIGFFRFPTRYIVLFQLAATILAAIGFLKLVQVNRCERHRYHTVRAFDNTGYKADLVWQDCWPIWLLVIVSILVAVAGTIVCDAEHLAFFPLATIGPVLFITAALLVFFAARGNYKALVSLIILAAVDLGAYGLSYSIYPDCPRLKAYVETIETPPGKINGRVVASLFKYNEPGRRTGDQMIMLGWDRADGYAGLEPGKMLNYKTLPALQVAGVHWVRRGSTTNDIVGLIPHDDEWFEASSPLPRVRLVNQTINSDNPAADLAKIDIEKEVLADVPLVFPASKAGKASIIAERPGYIEIRTNTTAPQLLVVAESYHPGWKATVNDVETAVYRINGDFIGCIVGTGTQSVSLDFRPASLRTGRLISYMGLGFLPFCFLGIYFKPKSSNSKELVL